MRKPVTLIIDAMIILYLLFLAVQLLFASFSAAPFSREWLMFAAPDALAVFISILAFTSSRLATIVVIVYLLVVIGLWIWPLHQAAKPQEALKYFVFPASIYALLVFAKRRTRHNVTLPPR